jgi:hypothetical protein
VLLHGDVGRAVSTAAAAVGIVPEPDLERRRAAAIRVKLKIFL